MIRGERERSPPLPEIMQSRFPHLGNSHGSATASVQWLSLAMGEPIQFLGVYLSQAQSYILQHGFKVKTHSKVNKQK